MAFSWLMHGGDPNYLVSGVTLQVGVCRISTWMCQEVSKWLVNGSFTTIYIYTPHLSVAYNPFTNHLLPSSDIQVPLPEPE